MRPTAGKVEAMSRGTLIGPASALAWFALPLVPALLGSTYHQALNWSFGGRGGPDPRDWDWGKWVVLTGPLLGYGFLAGATLDLPDESSRRGARRWLSRRSLWVAVGPWLGFLAWASLFYAYLFVSWAFPRGREWSGPTLPEGWRDTWTGWLLLRVVVVLAVGSLAYGWLVVARVVLGRARRLDRLRRSMTRGLTVAIGFVVSLFVSFWAITEAWRSYFFDPRVMPALVAASSLALMLGCANTETYGEVRRRELFRAMLMAWLIGLALAWRWWSRPRPKPPGCS